MILLDYFLTEDRIGGALEDERALMREYPIEDDIQNIISILGTVIIDENQQQELSLDPKSVDSKCSSGMPELTRRKIKRNVSDYYPYVLREFRVLEQVYPTKSELIYAQVRSFYLKQKNLGLPKNVIYQNVVEWFRRATKPGTIEAPEVIAAFFLQNCEVFD